MTMVAGSGIRSSTSPSRSGLGNAGDGTTIFSTGPVVPSFYSFYLDAR